MRPIRKGYQRPSQANVHEACDNIRPKASHIPLIKGVAEEAVKAPAPKDLPRQVSFLAGLAGLIELRHDQGERGGGGEKNRRRRQAGRAEGNDKIRDLA